MKNKVFYMAALLLCFGYISHSGAEGSSLNTEEMSADAKKFVGVWTGAFLHQDKTRRDAWTQTRKLDGTFKLVHETYHYKVLSSTEINEGTWWVKEGYFYEKQHGVHDNPDKYLYEFIGENKVKFTEITTDDKTSEDIEGYSFIDTRTD